MTERRLAIVLTATIVAVVACSGEPGGAQSAAADGSAQATAKDFAWPDGPRDHAVIEVGDLGRIRIALFPEIAPATVENFAKLADAGFYAGTTFHRVIPGFVVQGGDPNTRDDDPRNDGKGHPGYRINDEFSDAPHVRGVVSMANKGRENSGGSQFFIVHQDARALDGKYAVFGRVLEGIEVVDAITQVPIDTYGRFGLPDRPVEKVVVEKLWIERR